MVSNFIRMTLSVAAIPAILIACGKVEPRPGSSSTSKTETSSGALIKAGTGAENNNKIQVQDAEKIAEQFVRAPIASGKSYKEDQALSKDDFKLVLNSSGDLVGVSSEHGLGVTDADKVSAMVKSMTATYDLLKLRLFINAYKMALVPKELGGPGMNSEEALKWADDSVFPNL